MGEEEDGWTCVRLPLRGLVSLYMVSGLPFGHQCLCFRRRQLWQVLVFPSRYGGGSLWFARIAFLSLLVIASCYGQLLFVNFKIFEKAMAHDVVTQLWSRLFDEP